MFPGVFYSKDDAHVRLGLVYRYRFTDRALPDLQFSLYESRSTSVVKKLFVLKQLLFGIRIFTEGVFDMRKQYRPGTGWLFDIGIKKSINIAILTLILLVLTIGPVQGEGDTIETGIVTTSAQSVVETLDEMRVTQLSQAAAETDELVLEEVVVTGTQIKGAAISEALSVSVISAEDIESFGISSGDELLQTMTEQGQNFQSESESISGGVNSVRGDIGAFNLRNMGTGNTLVLLNGRRMVQSAGYQTEEIGGSFVPVNSVNSNEIPVLGVRRVESLRDGD